MSTAWRIFLGVVAFGLVLCAGGAFFFFHVLDEGDGISDIDDPRPARVVVEVRDDADAPLAGARVDAYLEPPAPADGAVEPFDARTPPTATTSVETNAAGTAEFPSLASGRWTLVARAAGHATRTRSVEGGHAGRARVAFRLGAPLRLEGRVRDVDGKAIEDAVVFVDESGCGGYGGMPETALPRAACGAGGRFEFADLPAVPVRVWIARPSDLPFDWGEVLATDVRSLDVVLPRRVERVGVVTDDGTKRGVAGARVVVSFTRPPWVLGATTDAEGRYRLELTPPVDANAGGVEQVRVQSPGASTYEVRGQGARPGEARGLDVRVAAAASVHGRVVGPAGPVVGAPVYVWQSAKDVVDRQLRATTDADGRYAVSGIAPGEASVFAQPAGCEFENGRDDRTLKAGDDVVVDFTLVKRDVERVVVRGRVESADGSPVDGATVTAMHNGSSGPETLTWTSSGADGSFEFPPMPDGVKLQLVVSAARFRESTTPWKSAGAFASGTTVRLAPGVRVEGHVRTHDGKPVPHARVAVGAAATETDPADPLGVLWADDGASVADVDGRYVAWYAGDAASFVVVAHADGFAPTASAPIAALDAASVDLVLDAGLPIRGVVLGANDRPVPGAVVGLGAKSQWTERQVARAVTDAQGRFEIQHLPARSVMVVLWAADGPASYHTVSPSADADVKLHVPR